ncbi:hypothetical protein AB0758_45585 [Tolypothrix bouteillei VB521301_2]|uniref:hypothetical protein n=1 Tax=Tolypothrix bouteillei TaxID=1246981 RepID=UPI0038B600C3
MYIRRLSTAELRAHLLNETFDPTICHGMSIALLRHYSPQQRKRKVFVLEETQPHQSEIHDILAQTFTGISYADNKYNR